MRVQWYGQSAFRLLGEKIVFIDPFDRPGEALAVRGLEFNYAPIEDVTANLLLITHEHMDHNAAEAIGGDPVTIRSTAGRLDSPVGEVLAIASEHDDVAGTMRGPNTIVRFALEGVTFCHLGDFGQPELRPEQRAAIGEVDVLFVPVGDGPTIGGEPAAELVRSLAPRLVLPMHYRTEAVNFLEPPDAFLAALGAEVTRLETSDADLDELLGTADAPRVVLFAPPLA
jgi:L-ascorbate metabolism protein UlaG (beta-lactamase superfamily)